MSAYVDKARAAAVATDGYDLMRAALKKKLMVKQDVEEKSMWVTYYNVSFRRMLYAFDSMQISNLTIGGNTELVQRLRDAGDDQL